jgi:uncharacterized protein (TIGR01777 family)
LIGQNLCQTLTGEGHTVVALSRSPSTRKGLAAEAVYAWEPEAGPPPPQAFEGVEAVIHLAGESIAARRWTDEQKRRIRDSRIIGTRNLVEGIIGANPRPAIFVSGSAVGFYGNRGDEVLDESSSPGVGFLPEVCRSWEAEALRAEDASVRVGLIRTGVVLSPKGGALEKMLPPFKFGVAGPLGSGRQWFPWIHIDDIVGIFREAILSSKLRGAVNGAAPGIVTNAEFTRQLAGVLHRPAFIPAPEFALRLLMGEMAQIVLDSMRVVPKAANAAGYNFKYPDLQQALRNLLTDQGEKR